MKHLLTLAVCLCTLLLHAQSVDVKPFTKVDASGSLMVRLIPGDQQSVEIQNLLGNEEDLVVETVNGTLKAYWKQSWFKRMKKSADIIVHYTALESVSASAGTTIRTKGAIKHPSIVLEASSGSLIDAEVESSSITVSSSSGANIKCHGKTEQASLQTSSGSVIDANNLESCRATAEASSGSSITISASESVQAQASSGSSIAYTGTVKEGAVIRKQSSGGSVKRK